MLATIIHYGSEAWKALHSPVGASILLSLFALSEALAQIDSIKSNSVFQLVMKALTILKEKVKPEQKTQ